MFEKTLSKISSCLHKYKIPYMVIGGQAVLLYGEPRLTRDIDITLAVNIDHLNTILKVVKELTLRVLVKDIETFVKQTMVLPTLEEKVGIRIDFIFSFTPYEIKAIKRAKKLRILGQTIFFASPEDLIVHKIFAGRPRDLEDVNGIILKNPSIDLVYIRTQLKKFDLSLENKNFLKTFEEILKKR